MNRRSLLKLGALAAVAPKALAAPAPMVDVIETWSPYGYEMRIISRAELLCRYPAANLVLVGLDGPGDYEFSEGDNSTAAEPLPVVSIPWSAS